MFDQEDFISKVGDWDWSQAVTWQKVPPIIRSCNRNVFNCVIQQVNLIFGKQVGESSTGDAMRKMFNKFLEHTTIRSEKKLHLARRTVPSLMEDMG